MKVYILHYNPDAIRIAGACAWSTTSSKTPLELIKELDYSKCVKMIKLAKKMKLSSVLDFPHYTIAFSEVSRSFTHQWVRYRIAAHMQQSLRYVQVDTSNEDWFVIPPSILKTHNVDLICEYIKHVLKCAKIYNQLAESGIPYEDARFILPIAVRTHISSVMDAEELLHVIEQRTCFDAQWEIRTAVQALYVGLCAIHPEIFQGHGALCRTEGKCRGRGHYKCQQQHCKIMKDLEVEAMKLRIKLMKAEKGQVVEHDLTSILGYITPDEVKEKVWEKLGRKINLDFKVKLYIVKH